MQTIVFSGSERGGRRTRAQGRTRGVWDHRGHEAQRLHKSLSSIGRAAAPEALPWLVSHVLVALSPPSPVPLSLGPPGRAELRLSQWLSLGGASELASAPPTPTWGPTGQGLNYQPAPLQALPVTGSSDQSDLLAVTV